MFVRFPKGTSVSIIGPLAKLFFATEITESMSFKSLFSKTSVCSVAVSNVLMQEIYCNVVMWSTPMMPLILMEIGLTHSSRSDLMYAPISSFGF